MNCPNMKVSPYICRIPANILIEAECLRALGFENMGLRRSDVKKAEIGTNHWLWDHEAFQRWSSDSSAILWIVGKPGSGKSVLAGGIQDRFLAEMDRTASRASENVAIVAAWFYTESRNFKSHVYMFRATLFQMLDQDRDLFRHMAPTYRQVDPFEAWNGEAWTLSNLKQIFETIILDADRTRPILLVLDGLDESEFNRGRSEDCLSHILHFLCSLVERATRFKMIFLSRNHPEIARDLRNHGRIVMQDVNGPDIAKVIENGIHSLLYVLRDDESSEDEGFTTTKTARHTFSQQFQHLQEAEESILTDIQDYLMQNADGVILWVKSCLAALERKAEEPFPLESLAKELRTLPTEMSEFYQTMVKQLAASLKTSSSKVLAHRAITWIRKASDGRGLRLIEVLDALSIPPDIDHALQSTTDPLIRLAGVHTVGSLRRRLLRLCGPFVEISTAYGRLEKKDGAEEDPSDQVRLIHLTAEQFLETDSRAEFLRIPDNVHEGVFKESRNYLQISFPAETLAYDPLVDATVSATREKVAIVLEYLERKPLLCYIFSEFKELQASIPERYRSIFQHTTVPPRQNIDQLKVVAEMYFHTACSRGWATAIENLICLQTLSLKDRSVTPDWYLYENSAIQGALRAAIRCRLVPEIKFLAWYVAQRGLDLLDFPPEGRDDRLRNSLIVREALETGSEEIALIVVGYADENERQNLLAWLQHFRSTASRSATDLETNRTAEQADIRHVQKAIWTVIQFWGSPPKRPSRVPRKRRLSRNDRPNKDEDNDDDDDDDNDDDNNGDGVSRNKRKRRGETSSKKFSNRKDGKDQKDDSVIEEAHQSGFSSYQRIPGGNDPKENYGANTYGANLYGANTYGANLYGSNMYGANLYSAKSTSGELNTYGTYITGVFLDRINKLSYSDLGDQTSILRGGRNLYNPRLPKIPRSSAGPSSWVDFGAETSAYMSNQKAMFTAEMQAQNKMQQQTTEEEFAQKMNDAAWKTASSAASDKLL